jgi:hypothetical protein
MVRYYIRYHGESTNAGFVEFDGCGLGHEIQFRGFPAQLLKEVSA